MAGLKQPIGEDVAHTNVRVLPTAAHARVRQGRGRRPKDLSTLEDARRRREAAAQSMADDDVVVEILLSTSGRASYRMADLNVPESFQALLACYVAMGELLTTLKGEWPAPS